MGFEFTRSTPEGVEENRVIVVQDLLDAAEELRPLEHHCLGCPAISKYEVQECKLLLGCGVKPHDSAVWRGRAWYNYGPS